MPFNTTLSTHFVLSVPKGVSKGIHLTLILECGHSISNVSLVKCWSDHHIPYPDRRFDDNSIRENSVKTMFSIPGVQIKWIPVFCRTKRYVPLSFKTKFSCCFWSACAECSRPGRAEGVWTGFVVNRQSTCIAQLEAAHCSEHPPLKNGGHGKAEITG